MGKIIASLLIALVLFNIMGVGFVLAQPTNGTDNNSTGSDNNSTGNGDNNQTTGDDDDDETSDEEEEDEEDDYNKTRERVREVIKEKTRERIDEDGVRYKSNFTFTPWQKRNESECLEGCKCRGAVMTCETENGREMTIQAGRSGNTIVITIVRGENDAEIEGDDEEEDLEVETELEVEQESERNKTRLKVKMSNGRKAEIKIMPDVASERALERLRLKVCNSDNNCTIELKETGGKASYEMQIERHSRILGIFKKKMEVRAEVDAESDGAEVRVRKPWWAFIASEPAA